MTAQPKLIAAGRASEIFDLGDGRVLRRFKSGGNPEREALVMRYVRRLGYPVPDVLEVTADTLVLELVEGPTIWEAAEKEPSTVRQHGALLARLHRRLHEIEAPDGLEAVGEGGRLLHLDLHPFNVILAARGPVVVDWANARSGDPAFDVALTWVIGATSGGGALAHAFLRHYLAHFDGDELRAALPAAAAFRLADANVTDEERDAIRELVAAELG